MVYDTNLLIEIIRNDLAVPSRLIVPIVVVGELEAFALKADWGVQKVRRKDSIINDYPTADIEIDITLLYAQVDAFSQGKRYSSKFFRPQYGQKRRQRPTDLDCGNSPLSGYGTPHHR